jgi:biopolymer transport protein TolR
MADPQEYPLSPAQRSKIRRLSQPHEPQPGDEAGELNIVPYLDIVMNILMFVLASVTVTFVASIDTTPPAIGGGKVRADVSSKALNLSAFITNQGISLKTSGGNIAPGCQGVGSGTTVAFEGTRYSEPKGELTPEWENALKTLNACAKSLKNANPSFKDETQVTITANPGVEYRTVIDVMDGLRTAGDEELFPEVHFGVAR